jgi:hypothetical protein
MKCFSPFFCVSIYLTIFWWEIWGGNFTTSIPLRVSDYSAIKIFLLQGPSCDALIYQCCFFEVLWHIFLAGDRLRFKSNEALNEIFWWVLLLRYYSFCLIYMVGKFWYVSRNQWTSASASFETWETISSCTIDSTKVLAVPFTGLPMFMKDHQQLWLRWWLQ